MENDVEKTTLEMAELYHGGMTLEEVGKQYGMSRQAVHERFKNLGVSKKTPLHKSIDKKALIKLYSVQRFSIGRIAEKLGMTSYSVSEALKFYKIPKRRKIIHKGIYQDFLRDMKVGDKGIIELNTSAPHVAIHVAAKLQKKKISMRKIKDKTYEITRVK